MTNADHSVDFFNTQFKRQIDADDLTLNPFEELALPHLRGHVLDFGCGMGILAVAAARRGCSVVALDGSPAAIGHLQAMAARESLAIKAVKADLRSFDVSEDFDTIVSIGLLMFFDCDAAFRSLVNLQTHVRPGGVAVINVLVEGTTYMDMFDPEGHCLFPRAELLRRFAGWNVLHRETRDFPAPGNRVKSFETLIARKSAIGNHASEPSPPGNST